MLYMFLYVLALSLTLTLVAAVHYYLAVTRSRSSQFGPHPVII